MKTNENFDNKLEIFTIFIRGKASFWDFGNHHDKYLHHLDNIALKGGTGQADDRPLRRLLAVSVSAGFLLPSQSLFPASENAG